MRAALLILPLALAACAKSDIEQQKEDEAAVAAVEAAQNRLPPIKPVALQSLLAGDRGRMDGGSGRCSYGFAVPQRSDPIFVTMGSFGWIKVAGVLIKLAGDVGSEPGPARTWTHYTGLDMTLRILPGDSSVAPRASNGADRPVRLVVRDVWDREVLTENLVQACTS